MAPRLRAVTALAEDGSLVPSTNGSSQLFVMVHTHSSSMGPDILFWVPTGTACSWCTDIHIGNTQTCKINKSLKN